MSKNNIFQIVLAVVVIAAAWMYYQSRQPRFNAGELAPAITFPMTSGDSLSLQSFQGKTVLIHFWGSWCGPCRQENPHLVALYNKYHPKGLEIISISVERNLAAWEKAKEELIWPYHVVESGRFDGPAATLFNVHQIPTLFLINTSGTIISTNPSLPLLDKMLAEQCIWQIGNPICKGIIIA